MSRLKTDAIRNVNASVDGITLDTSGNVAIPNELQLAEKIVHTGDTNTFIKFTDNQIDFQSNGSSRLYINQYAAQVQTGYPLAFLSSSGPTPNIKSGGTNNQDLLFTTGTNNPTRIHIKADGKVGIGISTSAPLDIEGGAKASQYQLKKVNDSTSIGAFLELTNQAGDSNSNDLTLSAAHSTNSVVLRAAKYVTAWTYYNGGYQERLRIRSDGKISVGTAIDVSNSYGFSIFGSNSSGGLYAFGRNHYLANESDAYASLTIKKSQSSSDPIDYLQLRDSGNNYLSGFNGAGNLKPASGKGIDFSLHSNAGGSTSELLADYEEGTWSASLNGHTDPSNTSGSNANQSRVVTGDYVKVGKQVTISCRWYNLHDGGNDDMHNCQLQTITGLPFNTKNTSNSWTTSIGYQRGLYPRWSNSSVTAQAVYMYGFLDGNSSTVNLRCSQTSGPGTLFPTVHDSTNHMYMTFTLTYCTV